MPFCPSCGAAVEGKSCSKCGSLVVTAAATTSSLGSKRAVAALLVVASLWTVFKALELMSGGGVRALDVTNPSLAGIIGIGSWVAYFFFRSKPGEYVALALCYVLGFITGIIFLATPPDKQDRVVRFHAFQSIFLSVGCFVIQTALVVVLPSPLFFVGALVMLALLALWLYMIASAYQGRTVVLPVVGPLAQQAAQKSMPQREAPVQGASTNTKPTEEPRSSSHSNTV